VAALWGTSTDGADPSSGETLLDRLTDAAQKRFSPEWQGPEISHVELAADPEGAFWLAFQRVRRYWDRKSAPERDIFIWIGWEQISRDACGACLGATAPKAFEHVVQIKKVMGPLCYRCPWNQARPQRDTDARLYRSCGWECLFQLDQAIMEAGKRLAGVILAPLVQRQGGMVMFPPGYLRGVRERCESSHVPFIADETASAFGRTGSFFACEQEAVRPDLLIIGDSLGNGVLPIGAVLGSEPIMNDASAGACAACPAGKTPDHGLSVAACAALGMMDHLEDFWPKESTAELGLALRKQAERFWDIPFVGDIRCCGMIAAIELVGNWKTRKQFAEKRDIGRKICARAHQARLHVPHLGDVLVLAPPFGMSSAQLEEATDTLLEATMEVLMADDQSISSKYPGDEAESHRKGS
jgi:adenosylmethionine-8-amino-7-oxononanoate aminotransferase